MRGPTFPWTASNAIRVAIADEGHDPSRESSDDVWLEVVVIKVKRV